MQNPGDFWCRLCLAPGIQSLGEEFKAWAVGSQTSITGKVNREEASCWDLLTYILLFTRSAHSSLPVFLALVVGKHFSALITATLLIYCTLISFVICLHILHYLRTLCVLLSFEASRQLGIICNKYSASSNFPVQPRKLTMLL